MKLKVLIFWAICKPQIISLCYSYCIVKHFTGLKIFFFNVFFFNISIDSPRVLCFDSTRGLNFDGLKRTSFVI